MVTVGNPDVFGANYTCDLPYDYMHILNCVCEFQEVNPSGRCSSDSSIMHQGANKLDTSQWSTVITNYYMKPSVKRPYYYIINVEDPDATKTNIGTRLEDRLNTERYGNQMDPKIQIKCGDNPNYNLTAVFIDYLRAPQFASLTQDELDSATDISMVLEFPDYVIYEIVNRIVILLMENASDQRMQTFPSVSVTTGPATQS